MIDKPLTPTPRQRQIIDMLAQGCRYKEIAAALGIADGTLKNHIWRTYQKFDMKRGKWDAFALSARFRADDLLREKQDANKLE